MSAHVVVVGGGLAGIAAALAAVDAGARVTVLEARNRLGGAAFSFQRGDLMVDNGQHVFLRCCTAYRQLLARIGAEDLVTVQRRLAIPVLRPGGPIGWLRRDNLPAPLHLVRSLVRYPHLRFGQRIGALRAAWWLRGLDPNDPELDERTFGDWLTEHGQHRAAVETLWELIARPTLNARVTDASLALAAMVFRTGLLTSADAADIGYSRVPLGDIHDTAARRALDAASAVVRLDARVTDVEPRDGGFLLRWGGQSIAANAVILAVPHEEVGRLLPALVKRGRTLDSSPIVNVHVRYDRRVTDVPFAAGVGTPVQWVFDRTAAARLTTGQYLVVSLSAAADDIDRPTTLLRKRYVPALGELFPAARRSDVVDFFVTRERAATFLPAPGSAALRPGARTAVPGLALAGAWTGTGWPATMEGAVRSGLAAVEEVLPAIDRVATMRKA